MTWTIVPITLSGKSRREGLPSIKSPDGVIDAVDAAIADCSDVKQPSSRCVNEGVGTQEEQEVEKPRRPMNAVGLITAEKVKNRAATAARTAFEAWQVRPFCLCSCKYTHATKNVVQCERAMGAPQGCGVPRAVLLLHLRARSTGDRSERSCFKLLGH